MPYLIWFLISVVVFIFLILLIRYIIRKIKGFFRSRDLYGLTKEGIQKRWNEIEELMARKEEMSYKLAVMEADKLLDYVLKAKMIAGKDLGERLKLINYKYPETRQAWIGHKVRNKLVHEASYHLDYGTAKEAIRTFKRALQAMGVL